MEYSLELSALAPSIKEQLEKQNCYMTKFNYEKYEKIRYSVNMLGFHITTESETRKNAKKLLDKIHKDVNNGIYTISTDNISDKKSVNIGDVIHMNSGDYEAIAYEINKDSGFCIITEKVVDK